jgi:hypothetical protein
VKASRSASALARLYPSDFSTVVPGLFSEDSKYGGLLYDLANDMHAQVLAIVDTLCKKLMEDRQRSETAERDDSKNIELLEARS